MTGWYVKQNQSWRKAVDYEQNGRAGSVYVKLDGEWKGPSPTGTISSVYTKVGGSWRPESDL